MKNVQIGQNTRSDIAHKNENTNLTHMTWQVNIVHSVLLLSLINDLTRPHN